MPTVVLFLLDVSQQNGISRYKNIIGLLCQRSYLCLKQLVCRNRGIRKSATRWNSLYFKAGLYGSLILTVCADIVMCIVCTIAFMPDSSNKVRFGAYNYCQGGCFLEQQPVPHTMKRYRGCLLNEECCEIIHGMMWHKCLGSLGLAHRS